MQRTIMTTLSVSLLLGAHIASAQIPVTDAGAAAQRVQSLINQVAAYVRQGQELIASYNQIRNQLTQIEHMVTNLQRIPRGLNMIDQLNAYSNNLTGLLSRATYLSYEVNSTERQFDQLYRVAATVATSDLATLKKKWWDARDEASGIAVQTQAIRQNMRDTMERIQILLNGSWLAKGNLDSQQLKAQQDAVRASQEAQTQLLLTTSARLQSMQAAEEVATERLKDRIREDFSRPAPVYEGGGSSLPTWRWTDR